MSGASRRRLAVTALMAALATVVAGPGTVARGDRANQPAPVSSQRTAQADGDPALARALDQVVALSPAETCLSVSFGGTEAYGHAATTPLVPASTEKLFTASVALDRLGPDATFETRVVASAPLVDGVIDGDLTIIGSGDPVLVTDAYRMLRRIPADEPSTSFDELAARVAAAGVERVTGRIIGDESRYDRQRTGPSWPGNYVRDNQTGPLSALDVDDGFDLTVPPEGSDDPARRDRSPDPAASAARLLTDRLVIRDIAVDAAASAGSGRAPESSTPIASITSPPVRDLVSSMLLTSDNQTAELLTKELGVRAGTAGSTKAGAEVIDERAPELGIDRSGDDAVDGSGLDPANRSTCASLVSALDSSGGPDGSLGPGLPVAGRTGTLSDRFRDGPAAGNLRAKTGSLNSVSALAGFVTTADGSTATFAYLANQSPVVTGTDGALDLLTTTLATYRRPCPQTDEPNVVAPTGAYAGLVGNLAMFPLQSVVVPGALIPLHVFEGRYRALVDRCVALEEDFGVTLIERGSEVGGGDQRADIGTRVQILQAQQAEDGRWAVVGLGIARIRVDQWLDDEPHPLAEVTEWPDPPPEAEVADAFASPTDRLRSVLALRERLGEPGPPPSVDLDVDPERDDLTLASFRLVSLSPLGDLDRHRLLAAPTIEERLATLDVLLADEEAFSRSRLGEG